MLAQPPAEFGPPACRSAIDMGNVCQPHAASHYRDHSQTCSGVASTVIARVVGVVDRDAFVAGQRLAPRLRRLSLPAQVPRANGLIGSIVP
jgi:hypothetical protein